MLDDKKKYKFSIRLMGIEPESVYRDKVYTQIVLIEFSNNQRAFVYDNMLCSKDMIGKSKEIALEMLTLSLEKNDQKKIEIIPDPSAPIHEIYGCIEELVIQKKRSNAERWYYAIVNFSIGKVMVNIDKKYFYLQLKEGDCIHVTGRVDLKYIN